MHFGFFAWQTSITFQHSLQSLSLMGCWVSRSPSACSCCSLLCLAKPRFLGRNIMRDWKSSLLDSCVTLTSLSFVKYSLPRKKWWPLDIITVFFVGLPQLFDVKKTWCFSKKESEETKETSFWRAGRSTGEELERFWAPTLRRSSAWKGCPERWKKTCLRWNVLEDIGMSTVYEIYMYMYVCIETMNIYIYALCILHAYKLISTRQCTRSSVQNR